MASSPSPASAISGDAPPRVVEDCLGMVQLLSDGTVQRAVAPLVLPGTPSQTTSPVPWKDVTYDETRNLRLRMYVPSTDAGKKLPMLVYFHGGGFCGGSFAMPGFHDACLRLAAELPAVVLSVDYRLAPEHRLPAALEDVDALFSWLRGQAMDGCLLAGPADLGRVFVSGDSAGANIAHHVAVRVGSGALDAGRVRIAGYVLLWPYFGGERRTASEAACPADVFLTLALYDQMWRLALPAGASRDHPAANPFGPESPPLEGVDLPPVLVAVGDGDMLLDRISDYVAGLKAAGKRAELVEFAGQGHGFSVFEPHGEAAGELVRVVRRFVLSAPPN
ncbi:strigolactones hydrolase CXE15-like [Lolium perenne]|uniref:strigolactones hydrolase CXE15-like n=1 Tax=Lolium perenne TaxID=4522 RepID=UPI0021EA8490|nr:probable carboxylesterase 15 [Lolium perenne]